MTNEILKLMAERRSIRRFKPDAIPREITENLIEAARWAPSAGNLQPWYFYVVVREDRRRCLANAALNQDFLAEAPVCIVVCTEAGRSEAHYGGRGRNLYCLQDTAAATQNILVLATAYGLGTCWVGAFDQSKLKSCMGLPEAHRPVALIALGYPAVEPQSRPSRHSLEEIREYI
ncbi:MAG: nitroreductase family protein [Eubacteriales bacterium]|nr:nitroreductase family protein [Eubacteriales bacterium]